MPKGEKGFVYSTVKEEERFLALLEELFSKDYFVFVENPQDPNTFGTENIPDSIEFPGFIFDSKKEVRWYTNGDRFFVTIISDEPIPNFSEIEGSWTRERVGEYIKVPEQNDEEGIFLVNPNSLHTNIRSETLIKYLSKTSVLKSAELFSKDSVPIFLTFRGWRE